MWTRYPKPSWPRKGKLARTLPSAWKIANLEHLFQQNTFHFNRCFNFQWSTIFKNPFNFLQPFRALLSFMHRSWARLVFSTRILNTASTAAPTASPIGSSLLTCQQIAVCSGGEHVFCTYFVALSVYPCFRIVCKTCPRKDPAMESISERLTLLRCSRY